MSEFKKGDRLLVEAEISAIGKTYDENLFYKVEINNSIGMEQPTIIVDKIYPIPTKTYDDGLREAWETARLIEMENASGGLHVGDLYSIFGTTVTPYIFRDNTVQEAAAKIAEWEKKQEIHVGDVVEFVETGIKGFITRSDDDGEDLYIVWEDGKHGRFFKSRESLKKTGRTIDIAGLLAQIGGTEDARDII